MTSPHPSAPRALLRPPPPETTDISQVADTLDRLGSRRSTISANLVNFSRALRSAGFEITAGRLIDAGRSLEAIDVTRLDDLRAALRACFLSEHEQLATFDLLFDLYWLDPLAPAPVAPLARDEDRESPPSESGAQRATLAAMMPRQAWQAQGDNPDQTANDSDLLTMKDFATYDDRDLMRARRVVRAIAPRLATAISRRRVASPRGEEIDMRSTLRRAARTGGEPLSIARRRKRVRKLRVALLCDVSGSMDRYSRQLVLFLFALQNELRGVNTFVFSTRIQDVTALLRTRSFDEALARAARDVDGWSGGTSIGRCLADFERNHARRRIDSRTVIVVISDGWERGDVTLLQQALAGLKRRARAIIWLNPLLGHPEYRPLARGMAAALPYTDKFLPAHNLDALAKVARVLGDIGGS